jgi:hypothetical protein
LTHNTDRGLTASTHIPPDYSARVGVNTAVDLNTVEAKLVVAVEAPEVIGARYCVLVLSLVLKARSARCDPINVEHLEGETDVVPASTMTVFAREMGS